jgi:hypothetical protein
MIPTPQEIEEIERKDKALQLAFEEFEKAGKLLALSLARREARQGREPSEEEKAEDAALADKIHALLSDQNLRILQEAFAHEPADHF